ncbi:MAG TPA: GNAT family N-acetyltransferase [Pseudolysinimonas sp.]|nr:GNAT family N-acetyltransferase [Pseudolysinimonas sp.]
MSGYVVRVATVDDAEGIARVHVGSWQQTYSSLVEPGELNQLSIERRAERWATNLAGGTEVWVAEADGAVIGFAGIGGGDHDEQPRPLELGALYVLEDHHGTGAGQALLDAAIGDSPAFLFVADRNPRATRFYERNGFAFDGVTEHHPLVRTPVLSLRMVR